MNNKYSQLKAMLAITIASLRSISRNPSAIVFNLIFPLIFIIVFGFISSGGFVIDVAIDRDSERNNIIYSGLEKINSVRIISDKSNDEINAELSKGRIDAELSISRNEKGVLTVEVTTSTASPERGSIFKMMLSEIISKQNSTVSGQNAQLIELKEQTIEGREFTMIDFILPGQLGFSLLSAGVFGTAFVFISLRQTQVMKRFFATPVKKMYILLGESLSRLIFSMFSAVIIILIGRFFFGFTLVNGVATFITMLALSILALIVFLGFGFVVSGIAKNENSVPPIANLFTLPQFLLAGTFFPISNFPEWLQPVSRALPLTYLNEALRQISFEGAGLLDVWKDIAVLIGWGVMVYAIAIKVFKWE